MLALAVREAVTNVVRHAGAKRCRLKLEESDGNCLLEIQDDGRGGSQGEGMAYAECGSVWKLWADRLRRETSAGTRLTIVLPLASGETERPGMNAARKTGKPIRVVLAEDQGMVLGALAALLDIEGDIVVAAQVAQWQGSPGRGGRT